MTHPEDATSTPPPGAADIALASALVPWWHFHRRAYDWVLSLAHHKHSTIALFLLSFAESSFFPIPPDVLQIALTLERRAKAWWYAGVSTAASVLGALAGYIIGWGFWEVLEQPFYDYVPGFTPEAFQRVAGLYESWNFWIVFIAAFTPIPYKVITITAGVFHIALLPFIVASIIGRGARFFLVAALLWWFGAPIKAFVEKYFNLLTLVFGVLIVGGFLIMKWLH